MAHIVFIIILAIVILDFVFEQTLSYLNTTRWSEKLSEALQGIYNEEEYAKSQAYGKANRKFGMITSTVSFVLILAMLLFQGFALVDHWASLVSTQYIVTALIFFAIIGLGFDLLTTPFSVYETFVIEQRFGFNTTTPRLFITDKLKSWLLAAILGGGLLALLMWIWKLTGGYFWLIAWGVVTLISLFLSMFYSSLIVPLFNKQRPLEEGELKDAIVRFAGETGFQLKNIFVIDSSKRSTKANAYFTGFGPKKRIVLFDTLITDLTTDEIVAVLAHEIGHYKKRHTLIGLFLGILQSGIMLFIFSLLISSPWLSQALGVGQVKFHIGLIAFGILYTPLSFLMGIGLNCISRKHEYQADAFAAQHHLAGALGSALKKLSVKSLSNLTPHPAYVLFYYSHPTLLQRLEKLHE